MAERVFGGQLAQLLMQLSNSQESGVLALFSNQKATQPHALPWSDYGCLSP